MSPNGHRALFLPSHNRTTLRLSGQGGGQASDRPILARIDSLHRLSDPTGKPSFPVKPRTPTRLPGVGQFARDDQCQYLKVKPWKSAQTSSTSPKPTWNVRQSCAFPPSSAAPSSGPAEPPASTAALPYPRPAVPGSRTHNAVLRAKTTARSAVNRSHAAPDDGGPANP